MSVCVMDCDVDVAAVREVGQAWPAEAREMMSRLTDAFPPLMERRQLPRKTYRVEAKLLLLHGPRDAAPQRLYSRDVNPWSMGFITPHRLPAYEHALLEMRAEDGRLLRLKCLIRRCKAFAPGWSQGVLDFEREQPEFAM